MDAIAERDPLVPELDSNNPDVLRASLLREVNARRNAECRARMQDGIVNLAVELLVREPDVEGFFGALAKTMVEDSESHTCAVWLLDDEGKNCELWMAYVRDRLFMPRQHGRDTPACAEPGKRPFPCEAMATHLHGYGPGWEKTIEYTVDDERLPEVVRSFQEENVWVESVATPLLLAGRNLGWMTVCSARSSSPESRWWRVALIEAIARQAALALHHSRLVEENRREERRKAVLEERNRLARDIHDNLAQGFAAILMQLQAARRDASCIGDGAAPYIDTALALARTHLIEARRSVGALRPNVGNGEDLAASLQRVADLGRRTSSVPIDLVLDDLPRLGDSIEREVVAIAQEAVTNAVRHAEAQRIIVRAEAIRSVGLRLSVADDGRGMGNGARSGFGMLGMQERAERIGASLTIVTAPRNGTEVVLAWEPSALFAQVQAGV